MFSHKCHIDQKLPRGRPRYGHQAYVGGGLSLTTSSAARAARPGLRPVLPVCFGPIMSVASPGAAWWHPRRSGSGKRDGHHDGNGGIGSYVAPAGGRVAPCERRSIQRALYKQRRTHGGPDAITCQPPCHTPETISEIDVENRTDTLNRALDHQTVNERDII